MGETDKKEVLRTATNCPRPPLMAFSWWSMDKVTPKVRTRRRVYTHKHCSLFCSYDGFGCRMVFVLNEPLEIGRCTFRISPYNTMLSDVTKVASVVLPVTVVSCHPLAKTTSFEVFKKYLSY